MSKPRCSTCRFFKRQSLQRSTYECHRFPPTMMKRDSTMAMWEWPTVELSDWCGEYRAHVPKKAEK